ncbi:MAG: SDR family NAD(P)-dependent oxidoreductase [Granulosicoccus sp.]|nr:SDR family NAD(P)-dependent oxidoreductase [Granulosicoccus sp.]
MSNKNLILCDADTLAKDVSGKVYIVTGANSGVGLETTRQLVKQGGHVVMACRRVEAAEEVAASFSDLKGSYEIMQCDLADLQSIRNFCSAFLANHKKLDGLACNAGMVNMSGTPNYTKDGLETTIGISFFGHFLMTELLLDVLKESAPSRFLILSSVVHAGSKKNRPDLNFDDLNYKQRKFSNFAVYAEAKVACTLYALELADRLNGSNVSTASVHPGWARSNFGSGGNAVMKFAMKLMQPAIYNLTSWTDSSEESAQTSLHVLLSDDAPNHSGAYFSQHSVLYRDKECKKGGWPMQSPNPNATDLDKARKLVAISREIVGLDKPGLAQGT